MADDFSISMRNTEEVIRDLKNLVNTKGYMYAFCMILFEDFHIIPEKLHEVDWSESLSVNEASLLLGFLVQDTTDFSVPENPMDLINLKKRTYELMEELHLSLSMPFLESMKKEIGKAHDKKNYKKEMKEFFGKGNMLTEPIFYAGSAAYDFQYLEFLERKYKYDKKWLHEKKKFDFDHVKSIIFRIKEILTKKSEKVRLYFIRQRLPEIIDNLKEKHKGEDWEKYVKEFTPMMELHQYVELFFEDLKEKENLSMTQIGEAGWNSFYKNLVELFVIKKSDFNNNINIEAFLNNFSITPKKGLNAQFETVGNYNVIDSHPIIHLAGDKYFVPMTFLLPKAIYESPYYWMMSDNAYKDQAGRNRGNVGEEIVYDCLSKVFGTRRTYKSVKIITKRGQADTDIDVLCVLGSKSLCVQVKSKKLTELSRKGDDDALKSDFQAAVQDAYKQGMVSRSKILGGEAEFIDEHGKKIQLSEEIDEVYIMGVTTEDYPSLNHQSHVMLEKGDQEPYPIFLSIFDLELVTYYLNDPYDFLYYIRQRISLMDYFIAGEEMVFLGYHLDKKLWKNPKAHMISLDRSFAQLIDRNYYPLKAGLKVSDEGDVIKNRWRNEKFDRLSNELKYLNEAKVTDILFYLFDWSGEARERLVESMISVKQKTILDGEAHDFSIPPDNSYSPRVGVTYYSLNSDNIEELKKRLLFLFKLRKYRSKGDVWIGLGSLKSSPNMIDIVVFDDQNWEYDEELERLSNDFWGGKRRGRLVNFGKEIDGNEMCPCGSGVKFKNCCGR
jgi:hypothetical protein